MEVRQRDEKTSAVLGAAIEVHSVIGHGFLEAVYLNALCCELKMRGVPHFREVAIPVFYKENKLACGYRTDLICFRDLLVGIKAQAGLTDIDVAQVINYLRATELERALLINFGTKRLQIRRLILTGEYRHRMPDDEVDVSGTTESAVCIGR
jgi:GxxExxY protein